MSSFINDLAFVNQPLAALKLNPRNARTHSKRQIRQIADSIKTFGFTNPVLVDKDNMVVAGHGRLAGAKLLGMTEVPTIRLENLTPDQIRAYVIADNKLALNAGWDEEILAIELQYLLTIETDFAITTTGFEMPEIDLIISESAEASVKPDPADNLDNIDSLPAVTRPGDLWQLGPHRILCGSALDPACYQTLLGDKRAHLVFADPPYNVTIDGNVGNIGGKAATKYREFQMAAGEMTEAQFTTFLENSLGLMAEFSTQGSVHYVCMDWRHVGELTTVGRDVYDAQLNLCVWVKDNGGMGSLYRSQHELVFVFRHGKAKHRNNIQLGRYGRYRTNVWKYPGVNTFSKQGDEGKLLALHPTVKPVALVADALLDCSARGDIVLDGFLGSGSTLIAAERTGRICYGIELDRGYVDTAIRRWQRHAGDHAIHAVTGERFDDVAAGVLETHA